jgi:hypothetical protein
MRVHTDQDAKAFTVNVTADIVTRKYLVLRHVQTITRSHKIWRHPPQDTTALLLSKVGAGRSEWEGSVYSIGQFIADAKPVTPKLPFEYPSTQGELDMYKKWLVAMVGSEYRLQDGWGHSIRINLGHKSKQVLLIVSSGGSDGKWNTADDMVIKRDAKTGQIVEKIGFGAEK